jgi:hypothetical protein
MRFLTIGMCLAVCGILAAADKNKKTPGPVEGGNDVVDITATALVDKDAVTEALGRDPGLDLIAVRVKVVPKGDNKVQVWRDDFTLLSGKDGQKSQPLEPGQIAGKGALMVTSQGVRGSGGAMGGPTFGIPGLGRMGSSGGGVGNGASTTENKTTVQAGGDEPDNPLLQVLKDKVLPEKETNDPVAGLLYFIFDGKPPKIKDLTLIYKNQGTRLILDFKP